MGFSRYESGHCYRDVCIHTSIPISARAGRSFVWRFTVHNSTRFDLTYEGGDIALSIQDTTSVFIRNHYFSSGTTHHHQPFTFTTTAHHNNSTPIPWVPPQSEFLASCMGQDFIGTRDDACRQFQIPCVCNGRYQKSHIVLHRPHHKAV